MIGYTSLFEQPKYSILQQLSSCVEIREYNERTFAEVCVNGTGMSARRNAFRLLLHYIKGSNDAAKKISMTIPVSAFEVNSPSSSHSLTSSAQGNSYAMRFFLPHTFNINSAPYPKNQKIKIKCIPYRLEAALTYTGSQSDARAKLHMEQLIDILSPSEWKPAGAYMALYYNPPFSIPLFRRNEVTVPVAKG